MREFTGKRIRSLALLATSRRLGWLFIRVCASPMLAWEDLWMLHTFGADCALTGDFDLPQVYEFETAATAPLARVSELATLQKRLCRRLQDLEINHGIDSLVLKDLRSRQRVSEFSHLIVIFHTVEHDFSRFLVRHGHVNVTKWGVEMQRERDRLETKSVHGIPRQLTQNLSGIIFSLADKLSARDAYFGKSALTMEVSYVLN